MTKSVPINKKLYNEVKEEAKKKFKVWPSAYASGWLVKEYKRRGGKYKTKSSRKSQKSSRKSSRKSSKKSSRKSSKKSSRKSSRKSDKITKRSKKSHGLGRWYAEEWINVCELPKIVPCGRPKLGDKDWKKNYPYCRPRKRINSGTPKTAGELTKTEIKKRCSLKKKNPMKRVTKKRLSSKKKSKKKNSSRKSRKSRKPCQKGKVRNRETGRCRSKKNKKE